MSGLDRYPWRFPPQYSAQYFETLFREVLSKADVRNAIGNGIAITSDGDSPATLTNPTGAASLLTVEAESDLPASRQIVLTSEFTATDGGALSTYSISITVNGITDAMLRQSVGLSVIGRSANTTGNVADIVAGTDGVFREKDGVLAFGEIKESAVTDLVTDLAAKALKTTTVSAGENLTGGGDLSANRTIAFSPVASTGSATASFTASNKPGANNKTSPDTWLTVTTGGNTYYVPAFLG